MMANVPRSFGDSSESGVGGMKKANEDNEEGEIGDDDEEDDPFNCEVCNMRFEASRPYFTHLHSVSHLTKSQSFADTSKQNWRKTDVGQEVKQSSSASVLNPSAVVTTRPAVMPLMSISVSPQRYITPQTLWNGNAISSDKNVSHLWVQQLQGNISNGGSVDRHVMQTSPLLRPGSNNWNPSNSLAGEDIEMKEPGQYVDHREGAPDRKALAADVNSARSGSNLDYYETERDVTPLIEGCWKLNQQRFDEPKFLKCEICSLQFFNTVSHELHLAGLRHKLRMDEQGVSENIIDFDQTVVPLIKKSKSRKYSEFEEVLHCRPEPLLGFDYMTEFRHLSGRQEYVCDLCDISFHTVESVVQHVTGLKHSLAYISHHDPDVYRIVADKTTDLDYIKNAVSRVEKKLGGKFRMRVKVESKSSDSEHIWKELEDDNVRPISALSGHRLNLDYSFTTVSTATDITSRIDSVESLLRSLSIYDSLSRGHPPSHSRTINRFTFLKTLAAYEIKSDKDADVCLQLANSMTLSLLQYRLKQLPSMDAIDTSKISDKLKKLCQSAETVADKMRQVDLSECSSMVTPVSSIVPSSTAAHYINI